MTIFLRAFLCVLFGCVFVGHYQVHIKRAPLNSFYHNFYFYSLCVLFVVALAFDIFPRFSQNL